MALNTKFNAKNGISVGVPSVSIIDNVGNAIFPTVSAGQYLGLQPSLSGLAALVGGNSLGSALTIGTNDNYSLNLETGGSSRVTVTSAGNVGIGTTASTEKLTVVGGVSATGGFFGPGITVSSFPTAGLLLTYGGSSAGASYVDFFTSGSHSGQAAARLRSSNFSGGAGFLLGRSGFFGWNEQTYAGQEDASTGIVRDSYGVIAQRNSTVPQELRIYKSYTDASNYERFIINTNTGTTSATQIGLSAAGTGQNRNLEIVTGGSTRMTITSAGNVGIGTITPTERLNVVGNVKTEGNLSVYNLNTAITLDRLTVDGSQGRLFTVTDALTGSLLSVNDISGLPILEVFDDDRVIMGEYASNALAVVGKNVGIGKAVPIAKLDILDTVLAGSGALSGSALSIAQTWNTTGNPTAFTLNVTNSASGAASNLLDLQVGGVSKLYVNKSGMIIVPDSATSGGFVFRPGNSGSGGIGNLSGGGYGIWAGSGAAIGFSTGAALNGNILTALYTDAANTLAQRNGINPQTFRLYNTYTDPVSAFERLNIKWDTNVLKIGTEKGSVGGSGRAIEMESYGGITMRNLTGSSSNLILETKDTGSNSLVIKDYLGATRTYFSILGNMVTNSPVAINNGATLIINEGGTNFVPLQVRTNWAYIDTAYFKRIASQTSDLTCWLDEAGTKQIVINSNFRLGVGTSTPNERLTVVGNISSTNVIYASGGNSDLWNSAYSSVTAISSNSANYILDGGNTKGANLLIGTNDNFNLNLETAGTTKMTVTNAGAIGIGTTLPVSPLHIVSGVNSNLYLGTSATNDGIHEIRFGFIPAPTNSYAASIVGIKTGGNGRGNLELRVAGGNDATNAIQSDTGIRITSTDVQILKPLVYAQDVLAIGDNYNSGVKAFKFTRNENKAAIWSVPGGSYGNGDIRFTTGNEASATPKTESDATFIISRNGGVVIGNSYIAQYPTNGNLLVQNSIGIGTTAPIARLDIADTTFAGSSALSGSALNITQTWATSGSPTAIKLNVTNTNSGAASNLLDLQLDNISRFRITKGGAIDFGPSNNAFFRSVINCGTGQLVIFARSDVPTQAYSAGGLYNGVVGGLFLGSGFGLQWSSGSFADGGNYDLYLSRRGAANLRLGTVDIAAPVAQTLSVQSVVAGTTNTAGTNLTITGSQGTGTGAGGSIIFQTAPAGSSGTVQNGLSAALTIDSSLNTYSASNFIVPNVSGKGFWVTGSPTHGGMVNAGGLGGVDFKANAETVLSLVNNSSQRRTQLHVSGELGFSSDLTLIRDAANTLAMRNGINPQTFRLYNTYTNSTTYERADIKWDSNIFYIGTEKGSAGGAATPIQFYTNGVPRMVISSGGLVTVRDETGTQQQVINNYACLNNAYSASTSPGSTPWLLDAATNNILHNYSTRLTVTNTGTAAASGVFTQTIEWPLSELTDVNGMVYAEGTAIIRCYYLQNAQSVRIRIWNNSSSTWSSYVTAVNVSRDSQWGVWRASLPGNYLTKLEWETTSPPGNSTNVMSVEYYPTRSNSGIRYPHMFAAQGASKLLIGGGKSTHAAIVGSGNTLKIRNGNDSADGSITAAAATFSTTLSVAGISTFSTIRTSIVDLIRSDANLMPGALAVDSTGGQFVSLGNCGNSNGTNIYGNSTQGVGIYVGSTVDLLKPTALGRLNGTTSNTDLSIYNSANSQTKVGIRLGNSSTAASSNIAINFVDYTNADYGQIRGVYNGAVQTGQLAFLTANGGALAETLRITNTGSVGIGTTTPNEKLTVVGAISSSNVVYASGGNSNLWNSAYTSATANNATIASTYTTVNTNSANWSGVFTTTNTNSANWSGVYTTTNANSANWNSVYSSYNTASATIHNGTVTSTSQGNVTIPKLGGINESITLTNLGTTGSPTFANLTVSGSLSVVGDFTYLDTAVSVTSALSVVNTGTGPALLVRQSGATPIAHFIDADGTGDIIFANNGFVGLGVASPTQRLTVVGNISSTSVVYASGGVFSTTTITTPDTNTQAITVLGQSGGQAAKLQSWGWASSPNETYIDGSGNLFARSVSTNSSISVGSFTFGSLTAESGGGTGLYGDNTSQEIRLKTGTAVKWKITNTGHLLANTDNTYDIGANGATRPRNVYIAGSVEIDGSVRGGTVYAGPTGNATSLTTPTNGILRITNNSATDFNRLQFGGGTSSFPSIKRNGATLQIRLADDSANAALETANLTTIGTISSTSVVYASGGNSDLWNSAYTSVTAISANSANYILDGGNTKGANLLIGTNDNFNLNLETAGTTKMTVTSAGDVGIGITSPAYKLAVNGGIYISAGNSLSLDTSASGIKTISSLGNDVTVGGAHFISTFGCWARGTRSTGFDATAAGGDLQLTTAGVEKVRVTTTGNVGIGTTTPNEKLTVVGAISSSNVVYASGGNSDLWNSAYTSVTAINASSTSTYTTVNANSANWTSAYTSVNTNSPNWNSVYTTTNANSANWTSAYTIVNAGSPVWNSTFSTVTANSANWNSSYTLVNNNNANWTSVYTTTNANSANWSSVYSTVNANSANYILDGGNTKGANLLVGTNDGFALNFETNGTTKMSVTSAGNVGIGTTTPTSKLEIVDTTSAISLSGAALQIYHTWNAPGVDVTAIKLNVNSSASGANSKFIDLQGGGISYFSVDKTGATTMASAVFVNGGNSNQWNSNYTTTNANSARWSSVYSTVNAASAGYIVNGGNSLGGTITIGTNDANNFNLESNGTARISMLATGQVGVGTLTPDVDFVVYKNVIGSPTTFKIRTATGTGSRQDFYRTDNYVATRFDVLSTNEFQFYNANDVTTPKYIINGTNGNFGIGTTSTVHKVTVGGSLSASGTLYGDCAVLGDAAAGNVFLERDAANILGIRNSTAAQTINVYGTYTSGTNFERLSLNASSLGGVIGHYAGGGGGVARDLIFQTSNATRMTIAAAGSVNVAGHFSAATKSFLIDHPTQEGKKLQYGVVESNQHSVLVRGRTSESIIELPEEWSGLVHDDSVTVQLTPIGSYQQLYVVSQDNQRVVVGGSTGKYNYTIYGERKDVDKLQTVV